MAKRPHGDVERTKEDLDEEFYAGIAQMRLEADREMQRWGYRPQIILPLPLLLPPPSVPARVLPGTEALAAASYATVMLQDAREWLPEEDLLESSEAAMRMQVEDVGQDAASCPNQDTASGQDAARDPDLNTASGQDAAPRPERETASHQDALPHPERDKASDQDAPPHPDQGTASSQVAPAQDADVQAAAPETEESIYWKDNCWWKDRGREQIQWYGNWQAPWSGTWSGASWSARGNWQEGRWDSSMDE
jgi:hypothetical protein